MEQPTLYPNLHSTGHEPTHGSDHVAASETHGGHDSQSHLDDASIPIELSPYTRALITTWKKPLRALLTSSTKISVSQTVSFAAFLYEKMRNAVEFREDHLIRRAAIERILKRKMFLNENGRDIAEPLIKELLWARYYENNTIGEEKIGDIQMIIDKYFFIRNELTVGRRGKEQDKIREFILEILSCEIQENLTPLPQREAFTNYVYQILRPQIPFSDFDTEVEHDTQVYIAVERSFAHSDNPVIRYHLIKLMIPEITQVNWKTADSLLPRLYDVYKDIEKALRHPFSDKVRNKIKKQIAPFLILRDIFEKNTHNIDSILSDEVKLKAKVDEMCRKRYDESSSRLRTTAVRSFIYILLTKVVFAFLIEYPYDAYVLKQISYLPIAVNVIFPPLLMTLIILTVQLPGDDNTKRIFQQMKGILTTDPGQLSHMKAAFTAGRKLRQRSLFFMSVFSTLYLLTYLVTFGGIIYVLSYFNFSIVSQSIFIFFVTLVTFFAFKVIQITQEYQVVVHEGFFSPVTDFFFLPVLRVGQWLSGEVLTKFNVLIFFFDFIIEMPFKAIVEVIDEWVHFVRLKKEEIM